MGIRFLSKGPSIYDVHTEGVMLSWTHVDGGGGPAPGGHPHRKLKLESTDVVGLVSSSHAKKLAYFVIFYQNFVLEQKKSGNFSAM